MFDERAGSRPTAPIHRPDVLKLIGGSLAVAATARTIETTTHEAKGQADERNAHKSSERPAAVAGARTYRGTAKTTIRSDRRRLRGANPRRTGHEVVVAIGPSSGISGVESEKNPFTLRLDAADERGATTDGLGRIRSAGVTIDPKPGAKTTTQYWDSQAGSNGAFSGRLRPPERTGGPAVNVLNRYRALVPGRRETVLLSTDSMAGGTELAGVVTDDRIEIRVTGTTADRFAGALVNDAWSFETVVDAERE